MLEAFPNFRNELNIQYSDISSDKIKKKYGELTAPVVILDNIIFSEGHVPIIKKLCSKIVDSMKKS